MMIGSCVSYRSFAAAVALVSMLTVSACTKKKSEDPVNTVRVAALAKIKGLDPIQADDLYSGTEISYAYEGLLHYHYLKRPYTLIPALAEELPQISKDGKTYTFKIKKGVLFHDDASFKATGGKGRELEAEDFVYSWKRLADPKNVSGSWWVLDGKIAGLNAWREAASKAGTTDYSKPVEGLKALDRYTLQVTLTQPNAQFIYMVAMPQTFVVPREAVETYGKEFINHAVGTGPYRLTDYNPNSKLVWDKNPTYRKELYPSEGEAGDKDKGLLEDAGQPLPRNDRIVTHVFEESQPMWLTFMSGKLEVSAIPKDSFAQAISNSKDLSPELKQKGVRLITAPFVDVTFLGFNMADPVIGKNKYLRQAMSLAYDDAQYIELFYNGRALPAQGPIPPGLLGYDPNFKNPYRQYNVAKAKELLAKAGYPNGEGLPPIEYLTMSDSTHRQSSEYAEKMFAQIGVKLKVMASSWPEFTAKLKNKQGQMFGMAWRGDYPDAENFLQLFYSKNGSPGPNHANYSNPEFDKLYEKSLTLTNDAARAAVYKQMVAIVVEDTPWIFNANRIGYTLSQGWTKNYKPHDFDHAKVKYYRVDPALKK